MRKFKYLVFLLLLGCLGLTSFSSAFTMGPRESIYFDQSTSTNVSCSSFCCFLVGNYSLSNSNFSIAYASSPSVNLLPSMVYSNMPQCFSGDLIVSSDGIYSRSSYWYYFDFDTSGDCPTCPTCPTCPSPTLQCDETEKVSDALNNVILYSGTVSLSSSSYTNIFNYGTNGAGTYCVKLTSSSPQTLTFGFANGGTTAPSNLYTLYNDQYNNYVCLYGNKAYFNAKLNSSSNTVSYEVYKLTDLYNEDICINNEIVGNDCSSIQESLSGCLEDYESVSNMNQSLSEELEACLESGGGGCNPEIDTGCVEGAIVPLLSWSVGLDSFSTPIINNLTLPTNYKGKLVDGVLSISSINQNLSIDESDYGNIKDSFISVILYIVGVGLLLVLVYYIKFYMFNIKD